MRAGIKKRVSNNINKLVTRGMAIEIAQALCISRNTISVWRDESKVGLPNIADFVALAEYLNVSLNQLAGIEGKDDAFNHPVIREIADILADMSPDRLAITRRLMSVFPALTNKQVDLFVEMIENIASTQEAGNRPTVDVPPTPKQQTDEPPPPTIPSPIPTPPDSTYTPASAYTAAPTPTDTSIASEIGNDDYVDVESYAGLAAGLLIEMNDSNGTIRVPRTYLTGDATQYYTLDVTGSSMVQVGITDGCTILVRSVMGLTPTDGGIYVICHGNQATVKKLVIGLSARGSVEYWLAWCDESGHKERITDTDWVILGAFVRVLW